MNRSIKSVVFVSVFTSLSAASCYGMDIESGLQRPLLAGSETGYGSTLAAGIGGQSGTSVASPASSVDSTPEKGVELDNPVVDIESSGVSGVKEKGCTSCACLTERFKKIVSRVTGLSPKQKETLGYIGVTTLAALNEVYSKYVNPSYGFPFALFIGQLGAIVAKERPYPAKFVGSMSIGMGISALELIMAPYVGIYDSFVPASAIGFLLMSTVSDLIKDQKNSAKNGQQAPSSGDIEDGTAKHYTATQTEVDEIV